MKKVTLIIWCLIIFTACKDEVKAPVNQAIEPIETTLDTVLTEAKNPAKSLKSIKQLKSELTAKGFQVFDYVDEKTKDTIIMQQYFIVLLKEGPIRGQNEEETTELQNAHLAHLENMYELGYADLSGPFGDDGAIKGLTIYNVPSLKMADSLAKADPMVQAGRLVIEIHPWWAAKGFQLR